MKIRSNDCLALLRIYGVASESDVSTAVDQISVKNPRSINTLASFRFAKHKYAILFDDTAEDSIDYIEQQVRLIHPNADISVIQNPLDSLSTYGAPYEGKDAYLIALDGNKTRLDTYLASSQPVFSRSSWQKHIKAGRVSVNDQVVVSPKYEVDGTETITTNIPDETDHSEHDLPIIYIDDDVIVVNKPVGVLTHPKNQLNNEFTVADFFRRYTTHGLQTERPGIVHRLDRDTSGVIIGARTERAYEHLKAQFSERTARKLYIAVTDGVPKQHEVLIDLPIARNAAKPGSFKVDPSGKSAQTKLTVMDTNEKRALVRLEPKTGRTHQLRVHLAHIGTPILGDRLYGKEADRLYLHAHALHIDLPNGEVGEFTADIPEEFFSLGGDSSG